MTAAVTRECDNRIRVGRKWQKCGAEVESKVPTLFSVDGRAFGADLCDACKLKLLEALASFIEIARPEYAKVEGVVRRALAALPNGHAVTTTDVRIWAQENDIEVSATGRIKDAVYKEFYEAHGIG